MCPRTPLRGHSLVRHLPSLWLGLGLQPHTLSSELLCRPGMILWFQFTAILSHSLSWQSGRGFPHPVCDLGVKWRRWGRRREERLSYRTVTSSHPRARLPVWRHAEGTRSTALRTRRVSDPPQVTDRKWRGQPWDRKWRGQLRTDVKLTRNVLFQRGLRVGK